MLLYKSPMSTNNHPTTHLRATAIAHRLQVDRRTVLRWIKNGQFPNARRISPLPGSPYVVPLNDIEAFEKRRQQH